MTEPDDVLKKLSDLIDGLENMNVQQQVVEPRKQKQLAAMLEDARTAMAEIRARQRTYETDQRLVAILEELREFTSVAERRLEYVETALAGRDGSGFRAKKEILEEGEWLRGMLAGPPSDDVDPRLLKDAPRRQIKSGLSLLAEGLSYTPSSTSTAKSTKP